MRSVLLVCGARELAYHPGARDWCRAHIISALEPFDRPTILHGGALGPDLWAAEVAAERGLRGVTYLPNGWRLDTHEPTRRWADGDPGPLARNRAMVTALTTARGLGWGALVVGYVTPWEPATRGTDATLRRAAECGLCVERVTVPALVG